MSRVTFLLRQQLDLLKEAGILTDIILECGKKEIPGHKGILSKSSDYFRAMFSSAWQENTREIIKLPNIEPEDMEVIMFYLYAGKIEDVDDVALLKKILYASDFLQINSLFEWCWSKLLAVGLHKHAFLEMYNLADMYGQERMITQVVTFLCQNFIEISETNEYVKLSSCRLRIIIQRLHPIERTTNDVINRLLRWADAEHVQENREECLAQILMTLDLESISTELLSKLLCIQTIGNNSRLHEALTNEAASRISATSILTGRSNQPKLVVFGKHTDKQQVFKIYNVMHNQWSDSKELPFCLEANMSLVWFDEHVYVFGGNYPTVNILQYCIVTNTVTLKRKLHIPVVNPGIGLFSDSVYIVNGLAVDKTVQCYQLKTGICRIVAQTLTIHSVPKLFIVSQCLYLLGYFMGKNTIERYDKAINSWTVQTSVPRETTCCNAVICGEKLLIFSKYKSRYYQIYDIPSGSWHRKEFTPGPGCIKTLKSVSIKGKCILLVLDRNMSLHLYDADADRWLRTSNSELKEMGAYHALLI